MPYTTIRACVVPYSIPESTVAGKPKWWLCRRFFPGNEISKRVKRVQTNPRVAASSAAWRWLFWVRMTPSPSPSALTLPPAGKGKIKQHKSTWRNRVGAGPCACPNPSAFWGVTQSGQGQPRGVAPTGILIYLARSNPQEDPAAVHPQHDEPEDDSRRPEEDDAFELPGCRKMAAEQLPRQQAEDIRSYISLFLPGRRARSI